MVDITKAKLPSLLKWATILSLFGNLAEQTKSLVAQKQPVCQCVSVDVIIATGNSKCQCGNK
jgi:hypothetical protein